MSLFYFSFERWGNEWEIIATMSLIYWDTRECIFLQTDLICYGFEYDLLIKAVCIEQEKIQYDMAYENQQAA